MHGIDYIALYLSVAFMCMALEFMMALKMNTNVVSTAEVVIFRRLTTFSITEILTQCLWLIDSAPRFQFPRPVQYGYNLIDLICTGLICYFWYRFIDMNLTPRENLLHRRNRFSQHPDYHPCHCGLYVSSESQGILCLSGR